MKNQLTVDIPLELNDFVNGIFPYGDNREFITDAVLSLAEQRLCIMAFADHSIKSALGDLRSYRETKQFKPSLIENVLFQDAMLNEGILNVQPREENFSLTNCRRARIYLSMPSAIIELINIARGKTNMNAFVSLAIFNWLELIEDETTMQTRQQYIQALERDLPATQHEVNKLRAKVARLEIEKAAPNASLELIGEVLIQLINEASRRAAPSNIGNDHAN